MTTQHVPAVIAVVLLVAAAVTVRIVRPHEQGVPLRPGTMHGARGLPARAP